jgi:quercetin dioxygenase-like cupin family protein
MSNYALTNLKEIEDTAGARTPQIEGRFARKQLESEQLGVSYFRYAPGFRAPVGHRHRVQEEAYVVLAGSGRVKLDDDVVELRPWDVVRVAPQVARAFEAGPEGLELLAVGGTRPEEGDGELVTDFWPD